MDRGPEKSVDFITLIISLEVAVISSANSSLRTPVLTGNSAYTVT